MVRHSIRLEVLPPAVLCLSKSSAVLARLQLLTVAGMFNALNGMGVGGPQPSRIHDNGQNAASTPQSARGGHPNRLEVFPPAIVCFAILWIPESSVCSGRLQLFPTISMFNALNGMGVGNINAVDSLEGASRLRRRLHTAYQPGGFAATTSKISADIVVVPEYQGHSISAMEVQEGIANGTLVYASNGAGMPAKSESTAPRPLALDNWVKYEKFLLIV
ncbi:MAG: hypothetical protein Q9159_000001 [Coniocarpon cinnabarinum]